MNTILEQGCYELHDVLEKLLLSDEREGNK